MVEPPEDFNDRSDDPDWRPPLPADDRVWRHPSEMSARSPADSEPAQQARRRWLDATPSRAGAWSAGIVGALLATGVVLVGTHLAAFVGSSSPSAAAASGVQRQLAFTRATPSEVTTTTTAALSPTSTVVISPGTLNRRAAAMARSIATVEVARGGDRASGIGVVVQSSGLVLVPAALVRGASGITVDIDGQELVARCEGWDAGTALALLHVNTTGLPAASLDQSRTSLLGSLVAVVWVTGNWIHVSLGEVAQTDDQLDVAGAPPLLDTVAAEQGLPTSTLGAAVIDGDGSVVGIVTELDNNLAVTTPAWLAGIVSRDIAHNGKVSHGWLGISGATVPPINSAGEGHGVEILKVDKGSAAARAGLEPGDVIEAVDGQAVTSMADIVAALYPMSVDTPVHLSIDRGHHLFDTDAKLAAAA